jgi:hypothetical protein
LFVLLNVSNLTATYYTTLELRPRTPLVLTSQLATIIQSSNSQPVSLQQLEVWISGLSGFNTLNWPIQDSRINKKELIIVASVAAFVMTDEKLSEKLVCTDQMFIKNKKNFTSSGSIFNYFNMVMFHRSVVYDLTVPWCPFLFANGHLKQFYIEGLVDSFLVTNLFNFEQNLLIKSINSTVKEFDLSGYNYTKSIMEFFTRLCLNPRNYLL